jgi:hypothetical protein
MLMEIPNFAEHWVTDYTPYWSQRPDAEQMETEISLRAVARSNHLHSGSSQRRCPSLMVSDPTACSQDILTR